MVAGAVLLLIAHTVSRTCHCPILAQNGTVYETVRSGAEPRGSGCASSTWQRGAVTVVTALSRDQGSTAVLAAANALAREV